MLSPHLFINNPLIVNQNADIYGRSIDEGTFDYTFIINVQSFIGDNITSLFTTATFQQNSADIEKYDINLTISDSSTFVGWDANFNNDSLVTVGLGNSNIAFGTFKTEADSIGDRLLEVIAHKLFGHAQARAAIKNDNSFYTHDNEIWDHLVTSVGMSAFRNDIFNQYIAIGRYNAFAPTSGGVNSGNEFNNGEQFNDVNRIVNFNFDNLTFDFPMHVAGNLLLDNANLTTEERSILQNGPTVGGTKLTNGVYNVPILVRFTC